MSNIELTTINKKIQDTHNEIQNFLDCDCEVLRDVILSQLENRLSVLLKEKEMMVAAATVVSKPYFDYECDICGALCPSESNCCNVCDPRKRR